MASADLETSSTARPGLIRRTLRRHWEEILALWLIGSLALGTWAYRTFPPSYRATSLLRADPIGTNLFDTKKVEAPDLYVQTQAHLIVSPDVLTAAGRSPKASALVRMQRAGDVVQELKKAISVSVVTGTYLIEVSMTSPDPSEAATLVNAVVDAFMDANGEWSDGMTRLQIKNLDSYSVELKNQTDELERRWKGLASKGDVDPDLLRDRRKDDLAPARQDAGPSRASITIEEYKRAYRDMEAVNLELAENRAWLAAATEAADRAGKEGGANGRPDALEKQVERRFRLDPEVRALASQMFDAQSEVDEARQAGDPAERANLRKLAGLQARYQQLWESKSAAFREEMEVGGDGPGKVLDPRQEVREAQAKVDKLLFKQAALKAKFERLDVRNKNQAADAVDIVLIQDERATLEGMQDAVTRRLEQLKFEAKGEARVRRVNPGGAMIPRRPIADRRSLAIQIIAASMLVAAFGLFASIEAASVSAVGLGKAPTLPEV